MGVALNKGKGFKIPKPTFRPSAPKVPESGGGDKEGHTIGSGSKLTPWEKPEGFKIIGLIFFGRPSVIAILDCYLKKNLVTNGGWLDEVHFVVNTRKEEDIAYLDGLVKGEPLYTKIALERLGYNEVWENGVDRDNMYIKIDDDIVRPSAFLMVGNVRTALIRGYTRYISTTKRFPILYLQNSNTLTPSTSSPIS